MDGEVYLPIQLILLNIPGPFIFVETLRRPLKCQFQASNQVYSQLQKEGVPQTAKRVLVIHIAPLALTLIIYTMGSAIVLAQVEPM